jgi:hypothetical protein
MMPGLEEGSGGLLLKTKLGANGFQGRRSQCFPNEQKQYENSIYWSGHRLGRVTLVPCFLNTN